MSLKAELETWASALQAYEEEDLEKALVLFSTIADSSKILTNMGLIYATMGEHETAVEQFIAATRLDQYLAVAYFQCGVSYFLLGQYDLALKDFEEALLYLRGNQAINYEQLGLKFRLFSAEVLFNKGLSLIYMGNIEEGLQDLEEARREKTIDEHNVIDDAIQDRGEGYTVFSIPVGVLYTPAASKIKNAKTKDYLGKAKLVAATDEHDQFTTFTGIARLRAGISPSNTFVGRPVDDGDIGPALTRALTVPASRRDPTVVAPRSGTLVRSKTTLTVPTDARERIAGLQLGGPARSPVAASRAGADDGSTVAATRPRGAGLMRSNTSGGALGRSNTLGPGPGISRGLSIKKSPIVPGKDKKLSPVLERPSNAGSRITEIYDGYLNSYNDDGAPTILSPLPLSESPKSESPKSDKFSAWVRANANQNQLPSQPAAILRSTSRSAPGSHGGGTIKRKLTRKGTRRLAAEEEEEEGYGSGEGDDGPFDLVKIRFKLHYNDEVRGMALPSDTPYEEFIERVTSKFGQSLNGLEIKFKDEDGVKVSLRDDSDYDLAIETAKEQAKGKPEGKLEIWCTNV